MLQKRKYHIFAAVVLALYSMLLIFASNTKSSAESTFENERAARTHSTETKQTHNIKTKNPTNKPVASAQILPFEIYTDGNLQTCKNIVSDTLSILPKDHVLGLKTINLTGKKMERRGYGGYGSIDLQCVDMDEMELIGVLIHEMGHITDIDFLIPREVNGTVSAFTDYNTPIPIDDKSVDFYSISWVNSSQMKPGAVKFDFVSLYAMTDPFEDFAETYTMYVLHGGQFRKMAEKNAALAEKYNFMKNNVFFGREFSNDSLYMNTAARIYDATRLKFSLAKFFNRE